MKGENSEKKRKQEKWRRWYEMQRWPKPCPTDLRENCTISFPFLKEKTSFEERKRNLEIREQRGTNTLERSNDQIKCDREKTENLQMAWLNPNGLRCNEEQWKQTETCENYRHWYLKIRQEWWAKSKSAMVLIWRTEVYIRGWRSSSGSIFLFPTFLLSQFSIWLSFSSREGDFPRCFQKLLKGKRTWYSSMSYPKTGIFILGVICIAYLGSWTALDLICSW